MGSDALGCAVAASLLFAAALAPVRAASASPAMRPTQIRTASRGTDGRSVTLIFTDGRSQSFAAEDSGAAFGVPRLSRDGRLAGWSEERSDGGSYALPVGVAVVLDGRLHHFGCDGGTPLAWRFSAERWIVLKCAFPHGPGSPWLQRTVMASGKAAGRVDLAGDDGALPVAAPRWARGALPD